MVETKYNANHHAGATPEARVQNRLKNSGGEEADYSFKVGDGMRRQWHNVHNSGTAGRHGNVNEGEGSITGGKR